jgi:hypothetical protein
MRRVGCSPVPFDGAALIRAILERIEENWLGARLEGSIRLASRENWRWEKKCYISGQNKSREKILEKQIARECDDSWINQVPTLSGVIDAKSERHCNVDLVHRVSDDEFEFIELKFDSDTPAYAAFEILKYGLVYTFSRKNSSALGYDAANILLNAKNITLIVLAPSAYYVGGSCDLRWLESALSSALSSFGDWGFKMDFHFESFSAHTPTARTLIGSRSRIFIPNPRGNDAVS